MRVISSFCRECLSSWCRRTLLRLWVACVLEIRFCRSMGRTLLAGAQIRPTKLWRQQLNSASSSLSVTGQSFLSKQYKHTLPFKGLGLVRFVFSFHACQVWSNTVIFTLKILFYIWKYFKIEFIPVMQSWNFSIVSQVFSVTWSFRNHSNMMICCSKHFLLLSVLKTVVLLNIYVWSHDRFFRIL